MFQTFNLKYVLITQTRAINVEDEATIFGSDIVVVFFFQRTLPYDSKFIFEDQSPSLSFRGHQCNNRQFIFPFALESFIGFELTIVSTQLIFSLDQPRDHRPD